MKYNIDVIAFRYTKVKSIIWKEIEFLTSINDEL